MNFALFSAPATLGDLCLSGSADHRIAGDSLPVPVNGAAEPRPFTVPETDASQEWQLEVETADVDAESILIAGAAVDRLHGRPLATPRLLVAPGGSGDAEGDTNGR